MTGRVTGFDHMVLRVSDVEEHLAWWVDVVGLAGERVEEWRSGTAPFPSVRISPTAIIDLVGPGPDIPVAAGPDRNLDHLCLVVDGDPVEFCTTRGLEIVGGPIGVPGPHELFGAHGMARSVYVHDPDANVVELRCYPDGPHD